MAPLGSRLREQLAAIADPTRAPAMQAYMKSAMPYLGVSAAPLRKVCRHLFSPLRWNDAAAWHADVLGIWRSAQYREERYAAIELSGVRAAHPFQTIGALPMYEELIVSGGWWDYVDTIAVHRLSLLLKNRRPAMAHAMLTWSTDRNLWKRRSAILCQLHAKREMDLDLLYACIEPSLTSEEFFLRKAIGWALRQYARTDAEEVRRYVGANQARLSALSRREALKHIGGAG